MELIQRRNPLAFDGEIMDFFEQRQGQEDWLVIPPVVGRGELITPNPKLKLLHPLREVMRLKHDSIRTKRA
jgi:hypothetical protein